eukprot:TRINITY_DN955_c0_g1_i1.p1 TRINITY_DN955_c0_g1~~TRINITY_DN955_c0_g1_i1.p1  ORF type:complete len:1537 (-),score=355.57 TRINITY_DN955_c0_g1_i1:763-5247(-)
MDAETYDVLSSVISDKQRSISRRIKDLYSTVVSKDASSILCRRVLPWVHRTVTANRKGVEVVTNEDEERLWETIETILLRLQTAREAWKSGEDPTLSVLFDSPQNLVENMVHALRSGSTVNIKHLYVVVRSIQDPHMLLSLLGVMSIVKIVEALFSRISGDCVCDSDCRSERESICQLSQLLLRGIEQWGGFHVPPTDAALASGSGKAWEPLITNGISLAVAVRDGQFVEWILSTILSSKSKALIFHLAKSMNQAANIHDPGTHRVISNVGYLAVILSKLHIPKSGMMDSSLLNENIAELGCKLFSCVTESADWDSLAWRKCAVFLRAVGKHARLDSYPAWSDHVQASFHSILTTANAEHFREKIKIVDDWIHALCECGGWRICVELMEDIVRVSWNSSGDEKVFLHSERLLHGVSKAFSMARDLPSLFSHLLSKHSSSEQCHCDWAEHCKDEDEEDENWIHQIRYPDVVAHVEIWRDVFESIPLGQVYPLINIVGDGIGNGCSFFRSLVAPILQSVVVTEETVDALLPVFQRIRTDIEQHIVRLTKALIDKHPTNTDEWFLVDWIASMMGWESVLKCIHTCDGMRISTVYDGWEVSRIDKENTAIRRCVKQLGLECVTLLETQFRAFEAKVIACVFHATIRGLCAVIEYLQGGDTFQEVLLRTVKCTSQWLTGLARYHQHDLSPAITCGEKVMQLLRPVFCNILADEHEDARQCWIANGLKVACPNVHMDTLELPMYSDALSVAVFIWADALRLECGLDSTVTWGEEDQSLWEMFGHCLGSQKFVEFDAAWMFAQKEHWKFERSIRIDWKSEAQKQKILNVFEMLGDRRFVIKSQKGVLSCALLLFLASRIERRERARNVLIRATVNILRQLLETGRIEVEFLLGCVCMFFQNPSDTLDVLWLLGRHLGRRGIRKPRAGRTMMMNLVEVFPSYAKKVKLPDSLHFLSSLVVTCKVLVKSDGDELFGSFLGGILEELQCSHDGHVGVDFKDSSLISIKNPSVLHVCEAMALEKWGSRVTTTVHSQLIEIGTFVLSRRNNPECPARVQRKIRRRLRQHLDAIVEVIRSNEPVDGVESGFVFCDGVVESLLRSFFVTLHGKDSQDALAALPPTEWYGNLVSVILSLENVPRALEKNVLSLVQQVELNLGKPVDCFPPCSYGSTFGGSGNRMTWLKWFCIWLKETMSKIHTTPLISGEGALTEMDVEEGVMIEETAQNGDVIETDDLVEEKVGYEVALANREGRMVRIDMDDVVGLRVLFERMRKASDETVALLLPVACDLLKRQVHGQLLWGRHHWSTILHAILQLLRASMRENGRMKEREYALIAADSLGTFLVHRVDAVVSSHSILVVDALVHVVECAWSESMETFTAITTIDSVSHDGNDRSGSGDGMSSSAVASINRMLRPVDLFTAIPKMHSFAPYLLGTILRCESERNSSFRVTSPEIDRERHGIVFALMDMCTSEEFKELFATLKDEDRDVFRTWYSEYDTKIKFKGKV